MDLVRTEAVVLRVTDFGEVDRIVTLFTRTHGKGAFLARGARRSKRRFGSAFEPYALLEVEVALGRGEVGRIGQARALEPHAGILQTYERMTAAGRGLEFLRESSLAHQRDEELFEEAIAFLGLIERLDGQTLCDLGVLAFWSRVLAVLGHGPRLDACAACGKEVGPTRTALFSSSVGGLVCRECGGGPLMIHAPTRQWLEATLNPGWREVVGLEVSQEIVEEAGAVIRAMASTQLGRDPIDRTREGKSTKARLPIRSR